MAMKVFCSDDRFVDHKDAREYAKENERIVPFSDCVVVINDADE